MTAQYTEKQAFEIGFQVAMFNNIAFAAWRMPLSNQRNICIGKTIVAKENTLPTTKGFLFHPYDEQASGQFIQSELSILTNNGSVKIDASNNELLNGLESFQINNPTYYTNDSAFALDIDKNEFLKYVTQSVEAIKDHTFQKVVPARSKQVNLTMPFDLFSNFDALCKAYPNAFVSVVSIPNVGTWIGATPEVLIGVAENHFQTVSLAGTQKHDPTQPLSEVAWTQKEIEEQAMVSRYIINCFKKIRLREFEEAGPKTVIAGNLIHLKTNFKVDMKVTDTPQLGSTMLDLLHPTSAVCGMPKVNASDFIKQHENGNREFYSGYLGPVNYQEETHLFVNLRCMQLLENTVILYAGAGVTEDSNPEKEWLETELKMNTLLNIIKL